MSEIEQVIELLLVDLAKTTYENKVLLVKVKTLEDKIKFYEGLEDEEDE